MLQDILVHLDDFENPTLVGIDKLLLGIPFVRENHRKTPLHTLHTVNCSDTLIVVPHLYGDHFPKRCSYTPYHSSSRSVQTHAPTHRTTTQSTRTRPFKPPQTSHTTLPLKVLQVRKARHRLCMRPSESLRTLNISILTAPKEVRIPRNHARLLRHIGSIPPH